MSEYTLVDCTLTDCLFYEREPDVPSKCRCKHPEKSHYLDNERCPLYRLDWQKMMKTAGQKKKR